MTNKSFTNRFKRLEGQLKKLHLEIEQGAQCTEVIPQFLAVKGAFNSAFEEYVKNALSECDGNNEKMRDALIHVLVK